MKKFALISFLFFTVFCCNNDDDNSAQETNCDFITVINDDDYNNAPSDALVINSLDIVDNCLTVNFSAGGCDGSSWEVLLIDSGAILDSNPPQRNLRLSLLNPELCEALITEELSFDISDLQVDGNQVILNVTNSDMSILYEY